MINLVQYLLEGTVFSSWYCPGGWGHVNILSELEARFLRQYSVQSGPSPKHAGMYGMAIAYCMAYTALTLGAELLGFSMLCCR